ncbi:peptidylprolyl isomerase [Ameyamaea chiangmaiensis]|uniref:Parvulin-like PPIase n=1 Tax=Ameyamaea chiangmaiensis TaxID=442969 RepID=A0A850PA17_9PROT|nr:peptidylprolyl isomerase [Ameyamaea chiangmaiensis]MBS4074635.1 peptidylprolyl isomerase [Ameyamaea chiangmaiensis]NVN39390.1 peptidylprolyl isomerase [Ameyamaea chiangmaiensis]
MRLSMPGLLLTLTALAGTPALAAPGHTHAARTTAPGAQAEGAPEEQIIAVINNTLLTQRDVDSRGRLFALSTGLQMTPELVARLRPQIVRQLIDERLRQQEMLSRHINIAPEQIAAAISDIERRNGMPENALRDKLSQDGVSLTTLIDQIRVQIGWTQVLRQEVGDRGRVTAQEIAQREAALQREDGKPQYMISEIFIPVEDPRHSESELAFTQTIIQELRNGAPFAIVAAQFSQSQTALEGGSLGWVQEDNLDPEVVAVARQMPIGAISNPIRVAGGYVIATLEGKRTIGHQMGTLVTLRQAFVPFDTPLNPQAPTPQQREALQKAGQIAQSAHSCEQLAEFNHQLGEKRPSDPGQLQLERINPQMRGVLEGLTPGTPSHPLVSTDGIDILMVCSRQQKNFAQQSPADIADQLMNERVEQASRQLDRDLHRRSVIDVRDKTVPNRV